MSVSKPFFFSLLLALLSVLLAPWFGSIAIGPQDVFSKTSSASSIFWQLRLPQVLLAFLVGSSLGVAGLVYQALFRNPLATPYTLGVASGASLGAVLSVHLGLVGTVLGIPTGRFAGFLGAAVAVAALFLCAGRSARRSLTLMLLIGVALGFLFSSMILLLQFMGSPTEGFIAMRWLMGGLETNGYRVVSELALCLLLSFLVLVRHCDELDLLSLDEDLAASRGVNVLRVQLSLIFLTSLLVGVCVSIAGPIGFVGLVVPHACRLVVGPAHRVLLPVVALLAGAFLVFADCLSRVVIAPVSLPVGVLTALLGGPVFLLLLLRSNVLGRGGM